MLYIRGVKLISFTLSVFTGSEDLKKDLAISELNDIYGALLTPHQHEIVKNYYDYDLSLAEIAEQSGVSRQAVRDVLVKAADLLRDYEEKLGVYATKSKLKNTLTTIVDSIDNGNPEAAKEILDELLREL